MVQPSESEANKQAVHRLFPGVNARDLSALDAFFHPQYVNHNAFPGQTPGPTGAHLAVRDMLQSFPDLSSSIEDIVAKNDKVLARLIVRGTHRGSYSGVPATGTTFAISALELFRMQEGQAVEGWMGWDMPGLMQQLGRTSE